MMLNAPLLRVHHCTLLILALSFLTPFGYANANETRDALSAQLLELIERNGQGLSTFLLPDRHDFEAIPQDPDNPVTAAKVKLGKLLFHETGVGTDTLSSDRSETYSCATCHHAGAGFKAGIKQGIGDGGSGFAGNGSQRRLASGMNENADDNDPSKPDFQPVASPAALNTAFQDVMLWDGALGNTNGGINSGVANVLSAGPADVRANAFGLSGLETQVLAGTRVHRLRFDNNSVLQTNRRYQRLYANAYPDGDTGYIPAGSSVTPEALGAAKAIAAYERTILANRAPFQRWLRGRSKAMSVRELRGAILFFDKGNCVACHTGPALSSKVSSSAEEMFFNVGFADLDTSQRSILGTVPEGVSRGRGNFTGNELDDYKFKVPQLYNLKDAKVYGHGASFSTIMQVLKYKNEGVPQREGTRNLAPEFQPLGLNIAELRALRAFIKTGLHDPYLSRYQPRRLPSGNCFPAADFKSALDLRCW